MDESTFSQLLGNENTKKSSLFFSQDSKLNSAIRNYNILDLLNVNYPGKHLRPPLSKFEIRNYEKFVKHIPRFNLHTKTIDPSKHINKLYHSRNKFTDEQMNPHYNELIHALNITRKRLFLEYNVIDKVLPYPKTIPDVTQPQVYSLRSLYTLRCYFRQAVAVTSGNRKNIWNGTDKVIKCLNNNDVPQARVYKFEIDHYSYYFSQRFFYITSDYDNIHILTNRQHLVMLHDIITQRFSALLQCMVAFNLKYEFYPDINILNKIFNFLDEILEINGNHGYTYIKNWEAICTAIIFENIHDPICDNTAFIDNLELTLKKEFNTITYNIHTKIKQLLTKLFNNNPNQLSQVFGLFRICGHPIIDIIEGLRKLKNTACTPRPMDAKTINIIACKFKELFCTRYYKKNSKWPPIEHEHNENNYIIRTYNSSRPLITKAKNYNLLDWTFIRSKKVFQCPSSIDLADVVNDTSQSMQMRELIHEIVHNKTCGTREQKSVLLNFLNSDFKDPSDFLTKIDNEGFTLDDLCYGISPKEREAKILGRYFGLDTQRVMLYFKLTEWLLSKFYLKYFPEITMTDNEAILGKKKCSVTRNYGSKSQKVFINSDFEKWNTNQRQEETQEIFKWIDNSFGYNNVFQRTHSVLRDAVIVLMDNSFIPPVVNGIIQDSEVSWRGHLGGIEGKRQKGWTLFTVTIIIYILENENCTFNILAQGDNIVIVINLTILGVKNILDSAFKIKLIRILEKLEEIFKKIGPPLKLEETWKSSKLFAYGKNFFLDGTELCMDMKRSIRSYECNNEGITTLGSSLSSITACCMGATSNCYTFDVPIFICTLETQLCLFFHLQNSLIRNETILDTNIRKQTCSCVYDKSTKTLNLTFSYPLKSGNLMRETFPLSGRLRTINNHNEHALSDLGYLLLNLIPPSFGGLPILFIGSMLVRGFPDPLTLSISILKHMYIICIENNMILESKIIKAILSPQICKERNYRLIMNDPVAINIINPSSPEERSKRRVGKFISKHTKSGTFKNHSYVTFLNAAFSDDNTYFDVLANMTPFNPRIGNQIVSGSLFEVAAKFLQKLTKSGTITKKTLFESNDPEEFVEDISQMELNKVYSLLSRVSINTSEWNQSYCSTTWANKLRKESWGDNITGVTFASPLEALQGYISNGLDCNAQNHPNIEDGYILTSFSVKDSYDFNYNLPKVGTSMPYFGSKTKAKLTTPKEYYSEVPGFARKALETQALIGWAVPKDGQLAQLIRITGGMFTAQSLNHLESEEGAISGSWEHRQQDTRTKKGGTSGCSTAYGSLVHTSTDNFIAVNKGGKNTNCPVQSLIIVNQSLFAHMLCNGKQSIFTSLHFHINCKDCIVEINEDQVDLPPGTKLPVFVSSLYQNPYCSVVLDIPEVATALQIEPIELINPDYFSQQGQNILINLLEQTVGQFLFEICFYTAGQTTASTCNFSWIAKTSIINVINYFIIRVICKMVYENRLNMLKVSHANSVEKIILEINEVSDILAVALSTYCQIESSMDELTQVFTIDYNDTEKSINTVGLSQQSSIWTINSLTACIKQIIKLAVMNVTSGKFFTPIKLLHRLPESNSQHYILMKLVLRSLNDEITHSDSRRLLYETRSILHSTEYTSLVGVIDFYKYITKYHPYVTNSLKVYTRHALMDNNEIIISRIHPDMIAHMIKDKLVFNIDDNFKFNETFLAKCSQLYKKIAIGYPDGIVSELSCDDSPKTIDFVYPKNIDHDLLLHKLSVDTTSAPLKLLGFNDLIPISGQFIVVGDGTGGFTKALMRCRKGNIYFGTIFRDENMIPHILANAYPSCLSGCKTFRRRLININTTREINQDITNEQCRQTIIKNLDYYVNNTPDLIDKFYSCLICDAEGNTYSHLGDLKIIFGCLDIGHKTKCERLIIKTYFGSEDWLLLLVSIISNYYENILIIRSLLSYPNNSEIYLICSNRKVSIYDYTLKYKNNIIFYEGPTYNVDVLTPIIDDSIYIKLTQTERLSINQLMNKCLMLTSQNKALIDVLNIVHLYNSIPSQDTKMTWSTYISVLNSRFKFIKFFDEINIKVTIRNLLYLQNKLDLVYIFIIFLKMMGINNKIILQLSNSGKLIVQHLKGTRFISYISNLNIKKDKGVLVYDIAQNIKSKDKPSISRGYHNMIGTILRTITPTENCLPNFKRRMENNYLELTVKDINRLSEIEGNS